VPEAPRWDQQLAFPISARGDLGMDALAQSTNLISLLQFVVPKKQLLYPSMLV
jgi:hypothetical protein